MSTPKVLFILECDHVMPGSIVTTDLFCYNCDKRMKVVDVHEFEWRTYCMSCNYRPWAGLSQITANFHSRGHSQKRPDHQVGVRYMRNPFAVKVKERLTEGQQHGVSSPRQS